MKRASLLSLLLALSLFSGCGGHPRSQSGTKGNLIVASIQLPTLKCKTCVKTVSAALDSVEGIDHADVDLEGKKVTVSYMPAKLDLAKVRTTISMAGYDADGVKRDSSAYEALPECCK